MRRLSLFLALLIALHPMQALAQAPPPAALVLPEGTAVMVRPPYDLRSDKVQTGDVITFNVTENVVVNGITVIARGAPVKVTIAEARHAAGFGQSGKLRLAVNHVAAVDGTQINLRGNPDKRGGDNTVMSVAGMLLFSVFFVFLQGREAVLKSDKEMTVYTDQSVSFAVRGGATQPQVSVVQTQPQIGPVQGGPQQSPAQAPPPSSSAQAHITRQVMCESITGGQPVGVSERFKTTIGGIVTWIELANPPAGGHLEVRWTLNGSTLFKEDITVDPQQRTLWSTLFPKSGRAFAPGTYEVEIAENGQVLSRHAFMIAP